MCGKVAANLVNSAANICEICGKRAVNFCQLCRLFLCWKSAQTLLVILHEVSLIILSIGINE